MSDVTFVPFMIYIDNVCITCVQHNE